MNRCVLFPNASQGVLNMLHKLKGQKTCQCSSTTEGAERSMSPGGLFVHTSMHVRTAFSSTHLNWKSVKTLWGDFPFSYQRHFHLLCCANNLDFSSQSGSKRSMLCNCGSLSLFAPLVLVHLCLTVSVCKLHLLEST